MTISFNQIPSQLRVPLFYAEFDNSNANQGGATQEYKVLLIGNKLSTGTKAELTPQVVTSEEQANEYFGVGSQIAEAAASYLKNNKIHQLVCVAIDDLLAGVKAEGTITIAGTPTESGVLSFMIAGRNIKVGVTTSDTPTTIATALAAAIVADTRNVVTATSALGVVTWVAKNKGEFGKEIQMSDSYFAGEAVPAGITVAYAGTVVGAGNPDVDEVWPVVGDQQYILVLTPYLDASNLTKVETELADRFGPLRHNDGYAVYGKRETFANLITLGDTRNSQFTTIMGIAGPTNPWVWAAALVGQIAASASIDPARPFQTLPLVGILAPLEADRFDLTERNQFLYGGIATFKVVSGDAVQIEGVITTFKENSFGSPDQSYLYLNTLLTLSYLRFDFAATITSKYPRHKLADDGTRFAPGQAVVTPLVLKAEAVNKFREWEEKALVEGFDQFKEDLIVERNTDNPNRIDILLPPDLVNQLVIVGTKIQFLL